ncbi:carbohydrate porin [Vibrio agarivorans]|uniref:Carbohydrate porin n=1 Tax=Vibrio agarivorans TaxID=153622 RepID=A0ABT7Y2L7_9VIBR|nr:carbohydrate porin [Vibrio agarivorans]MDN2482287.1 carbohydrate porin [Vibrio agarivorans]
MKNFKVLPLTIAVASSLAAMSSFAATDADVAALEARIAELETRTETLSVNVQEQNVLPADLEVPSGIIFSGYARYGAHYSDGDNRYVQVGSTGAAVGRLGNEANGGEVQLAKLFQQDNGAKWNVVFMVDDWNNDQWGSPGGVNLKKMYAGVTNVFESQPDLYIWGGRDFHQRPQQGINDYFWMSHDGQGAGFNNLNLGGAQLDMGFVGQVDSGDGGALGNDNGKYAITSKLHGIDAGIGNLDLYANYGFASDEADTDETAWQVGAVLGLGSSNRLILRYGDGADGSAFDLMEDAQIFYGSFEGNFAVSDNFIVDYLASYKDISGDSLIATGVDEDGNATGASFSKERSEYSFIVRPQYQWNEVHSTWLEAGYAMEDYDNGDEVTGWKVTLSQNISMGGLPWSRPMLRFYTTIGDVDKDVNSFDADGQLTRINDTFDTVTFGAMFEAWW